MMTKGFKFDLQKEYIIFGANANGTVCDKLLSNKGCKVAGFAEHNEELWGKTQDSKKILSLEELYKKDKEKTVIIIAVPNVSDTREQMGYAGFKNIFVYHLDMDKYKEFMENCKDITFKSALERCYVAAAYGTIARGAVARRNTDYIKNWKKLYEAYCLMEDELSKKVFLNLLQYKYTKEDELIEEVFNENEKQYYFDKFNFTEHEVFIDGGACQGDTILNFINNMNGNYDKIYAFEPNRAYYNGIKTLFKDNDKIQIFNRGIYSDNTSLYFKENRHGSKLVTKEESNIEVKVAALDKTIPKEEKVSFIKFDIEGSELEGLAGGKSIIAKDRPKLAISAYHKLEDFWTIPLFIKELNLDYKIYMRHYLKDIPEETVCYGVPQ